MTLCKTLSVRTLNVCKIRHFRLQTILVCRHDSDLDIDLVELWLNTTFSPGHIMFYYKCFLRSLETISFFLKKISAEIEVEEIEVYV